MQRPPDRYTYTRYLTAKRTVDDRALNKDVLATLREELGQRDELTVLEVGGGVGTMIGRLISLGLLRRASYTLLDVDAQSLRDARAWLRHWGESTGRSIEETDEHLRIRHEVEGVDVVVHFLESELRAYLAVLSGGSKADLLIANAFLDLVDVSTTLGPLLGLLAPRGLFWFSINFDGETIFEPPHANDADLLSVYHRSMDERIRNGRRAGDSKTGRHLFTHLNKAGASILSAGSSDWVVFPRNDRYRDDEAYFLHHIVHTVENELRAWPEIDKDRLASWVATRRLQIERGELIYIAHQLDFVGTPC